MNHHHHCNSSIPIIWKSSLNTKYRIILLLLLHQTIVLKHFYDTFLHILSTSRHKYEMCDKKWNFVIHFIYFLRAISSEYLFYLIHTHTFHLQCTDLNEKVTEIRKYKSGNRLPICDTVRKTHHFAHMSWRFLPQTDKRNGWEMKKLESDGKTMASPLFYILHNIRFYVYYNNMK